MVLQGGAAGSPDCSMESQSSGSCNVDITSVSSWLKGCFEKQLGPRGHFPHSLFGSKSPGSCGCKQHPDQWGRRRQSGRACQQADIQAAATLAAIAYAPV